VVNFRRLGKNAETLPRIFFHPPGGAHIFMFRGGEGNLALRRE
jgi:hypothetical protein